MAQDRIIRLYNCSKQSLPIQVRPPNSDFFLNEQQVHVHAGKTVDLPADYVNRDQVNNLAATGRLRILKDDAE